MCIRHTYKHKHNNRHYRPELTAAITCRRSTSATQFPVEVYFAFCRLGEYRDVVGELLNIFFRFI